jgi:hypothetical protein
MYPQESRETPTQRYPTNGLEGFRFPVLDFPIGSKFQSVKPQNFVGINDRICM